MVTLLRGDQLPSACLLALERAGCDAELRNVTQLAIQASDTPATAQRAESSATFIHSETCPRGMGEAGHVHAEAVLKLLAMDDCPMALAVAVVWYLAGMGEVGNAHADAVCKLLAHGFWFVRVAAAKCLCSMARGAQAYACDAKRVLTDAYELGEGRLRCPRDHQLVLGVNSSFSTWCDMCRTTLKVGAETMHCGECNFDLCKTCVHYFNTVAMFPQLSEAPHNHGEAAGC